MNRSKLWGAISAQAVAVGVLMASAGLAQADFVAIDNDQILDTSTNLIWLKNWNAAAGSSFDNGFSSTDGAMTWANAKNWAASLTTGGVAAGTWRLATGDAYTNLDWDTPSANEFRGLWKNVGSSMAGLQAQFSNVLGIYWSGSEYEYVSNGIPSTGAWYFLPSWDGNQYIYPAEVGDFSVVAVRSANVAAVPEPGSTALVAGALVALGLARRRRQNAR